VVVEQQHLAVLLAQVAQVAVAVLPRQAQVAQVDQMVVAMELEAAMAVQVVPIPEVVAVAVMPIALAKVVQADLVL
jgi:hypothetical protein